MRLTKLPRCALPCAVPTTVETSNGDETTSMATTAATKEVLRTMTTHCGDRKIRCMTTTASLLHVLVRRTAGGLGRGWRRRTTSPRTRWISGKHHQRSRRRPCMVAQTTFVRAAVVSEWSRCLAKRELGKLLRVTMCPVTRTYVCSDRTWFKLCVLSVSSLVRMAKLCYRMVSTSSSSTGVKSHSCVSV